MISDPEYNNKLVLVFRSGETIRAVGVFGESFSFIEIIRRGRRPNRVPLLVILVCFFVDFLLPWLLALHVFRGFTIAVVGCGVGFAGITARVCFTGVGAGLLVAACTLGRFTALLLRGWPRSPEGRAQFPDCPDA